MEEKERPQESVFEPGPLHPKEEASSFDSPESIVRDLLSTEKEIALASLRREKSRREKERSDWERVLAEKERELLIVRQRLDESVQRSRVLQDALDLERRRQLEQANESARELEMRRSAEKKKWDAVADELRSLREAAVAAQVKLFAEQERLAELKRNAAVEGKAAKDLLSAGEEESLRLKEQLLAKEEMWLKTQAAREEEVRLLQDQIAATRQALADERQYQGRLFEKKEEDIARLQNALQETVVHLTEERKRSEEAQALIQQQEQKIREIEGELATITQKNDAERSALIKTWQEERSAEEKQRQELLERGETARVAAEEQLQRSLKSISIIEQQLAEEQKNRADLEAKLRLKEEQARSLAIEKDAVAEEWKRVLAAEQDSWRRRQTALAAEFDKIRQLHEAESELLRQQRDAAQLALAEERKRSGVERENNRQLIQKTEALEETLRQLQEQLERKTLEWRAAIEGEQMLYHRQLDDSKMMGDAQLRSRDEEIGRLSEDLALRDGQVRELHHNLSLEKSENNARLDRIQEMEAEIKVLRERVEAERVEWSAKIAHLKASADAERTVSREYQETVIRQYEARIAALAARGGNRANSEKAAKKYPSPDTGGRSSDDKTPEKK